MAQEIKKAETGATSALRYIDPFSALRAETDRVFDSFLGRGFGRFPALERVEGSDAVVPSIDVHETETELDDVSCSSSDHTEHSPPLATGR